MNAGDRLGPTQSFGSAPKPVFNLRSSSELIYVRVPSLTVRFASMIDSMVA